VLKHRRAGWQPVFVHMTPGEKGHPRLSAAEYLTQKRQEAEAAATAFGGIQVMMPWGDGELPVNDEVQWAIADTIREYRPEVIVTHWRGSMHKDHRNTHDNVMEALFYAALPAFQRDHAAHRARAPCRPVRKTAVLAPFSGRIGWREPEFAQQRAQAGIIDSHLRCDAGLREMRYGNRLIAIKERG